MSRIEVRGLAKAFPGRPPNPALRGIDLDVDDGSFTAVLGPSGCGKTTLLRVLAGMDRADAGSIRVGGRLLDGSAYVPPERRRIGLVPQEGALFPHLDVAANVAYGLRRADRAARRARVAELLDLVDLSGLGDRRPHELSGGQQQRVALARALAPRPDVVLLDEPFSALDTALRGTLRDEVVAVLRSTGTTAILVTHDQDEALSLADHVAVMRAGRIVQAGAPIDCYRRPVDLWTARFLGQAIVLPGQRRAPSSGSVRSPLGELALDGAAAHHGGPDVGVLVRPEQLVRAGGAGAVAVVESVRFRGADADVSLAVGEIRVVARWSSTDLPSPGDRVAVAVHGPVVAFAPDPPRRT